MYNILFNIETFDYVINFLNFSEGDSCPYHTSEFALYSPITWAWHVGSIFQLAWFKKGRVFVLPPDGKGGWKEWDTPGAYVYGTGPTEMMDAVESAGLPPSYNPLA
jgi:hypothetical protein